MNIRKSLYRSVFLLTVIPFLMFSLLITQVYTQRLERVITDSLQVVADAQIAEMVNFCEQQKEFLSYMGTMDISRGALKGEYNKASAWYLDNMLRSYVNMTEYMDTLTIIDKDNQVVACSLGNHEDIDEKGFQFIVDSMGDQPFYISDVLIDDQGEKTLIAITRLENNGEFLGYILGEICLDFYVKIRQRAELWNEATFYLLDGRREIISAGTPNEKRDSFVTTDEERKDFNKKVSLVDFEKNPQGSFQYMIGGMRYITYYSDVEFTDWQIMLSVNMELYQTERITYATLLSFLVIFYIVLMLYIGRFGARRIVRPIQRISDTLKGIQEKQDYTLRVKIEREDELGSLAAEINELIAFIETEDLYKTQQQRLLQEKAEQDTLTKTLNKEKINQYLQESIGLHREARNKMAVLFVDIDDFKAFNTYYGHTTGDEVLMFLSSLLTKEISGVVGRVGGDEFLIVLDKQEIIQELDGHLNRVEDLAEREFVIRGSGHRVPVSCCIGAVIVDFHTGILADLTPESLISLADNAMYEMKHNGKNGHVILNYKEL